MSAAIREVIAAELDQARAAAEKALGRVQQLEELDAQAAQLDGGEASASTSPVVPTPASPPAPARRKSPTAAASANGRPCPTVDELMPRVALILSNAGGVVSRTRIATELGLNAKSAAPVKRVQETLERLEAEGRARRSGKVRGGADGWEDNREPERAIPAGTRLPSGVRVEGESNRIDSLIEKIVEQLEIGGRLSRRDLKDRIGDCSFEEFELAVDRARTLKKIERGNVGGVIGYQALHG